MFIPVKTDVIKVIFIVGIKLVNTVIKRKTKNTTLSELFQNAPKM